MILDRKLETTTGTGTGTLTLAGAVAGYEALPDGACVYCVEAIDSNGNPSGEWEIGVGSVSSGVLTRTTVQQSSNSDAKVNFSAGTKRVFNTASAAYLKGLQTWTPQFTSDSQTRIYADEAMTIAQQSTSGTGSVAYTKSTNAAPGTFSSTTLPTSLEAGAWLKVTASSVSTFYAVHLKRTA